MVAAAKLQAQKAANDFKDFSECRMTGKYSTMVKNNEYASAGLAPTMSVDGKVTTEKVSFVMEKMDKKEREALLGKAPKFMSYENMKGMAVKAAVVVAEKAIEKALEKVGEQLGEHFECTEGLTDAAADSLDAIAESGVGGMVGEQLAAALGPAAMKLAVAKLRPLLEKKLPSPLTWPDVEPALLLIDTPPSSVSPSCASLRPRLSAACLVSRRPRYDLSSRRPRTLRRR